MVLRAGSWLRAQGPISVGSETLCFAGDRTRVLPRGNPLPASPLNLPGHVKALGPATAAKLVQPSQSPQLLPSQELRHTPHGGNVGAAGITRGVGGTSARFRAGSESLLPLQPSSQLAASRLGDVSVSGDQDLQAMLPGNGVLRPLSRVAGGGELPWQPAGLKWGSRGRGVRFKRWEPDCGGSEGWGGRESPHHCLGFGIRNPSEF